VPIFKPSALACGSVASVFFGFIFLIHWGHVLFLSQKLYAVLLTLIAVVFLIRAMGDFKYVGFFKKVRNTRFAKLDMNFYSPLCVAVSVTIFIKFLVI